MKMVSAVTIAVIKEGKLLLFDKKDGHWGFIYEEFDGKLNGNLNDTAKRALVKLVNCENNVDYLGSFIRNENSRITIMYNFILKVFGEVSVFGKHKWVDQGVLPKTKLDKNSSTFLSVNNTFL